MVSDIAFLGNSFTDFSQVLVYTSYSLFRMTLALVISYAFAIVYGIAAARNKGAERVLMPVLDILQSVPILGFFPAAIFFFIALFHESWFGVELAAIFLIFTSQAWNLAFAVYESVSSIPADLDEASGSLRLKRWTRFRTLYLPSSISKLIYNGILSWSAGWYYLVAAEIISIGSKQYSLPGIGRYLAEATYAGNYQGTVLGLASLVLIILVVDLILWRPLRKYAERFRYEATSSEQESQRAFFVDARVAWLKSHLVLSLPSRPHGLSQVITTSRIGPLVTGVKHVTEKPRGVFHSHVKLTLIALGAIIALVLFTVGHGLLYDLISFPNTLSQDIKKPEITSQVNLIPAALGTSMIRLLIAYLLSIAWILPLAVKLAGKPRSFGTSIFTMEVLASLPATALFPLIILATVNLPGGLQLTSIILTMTGMQWYLLFNVLGAVKSIPSDLVEVSKTYKITGLQKLRKFILPAVLPSFITGSITAWGGGWNALVLSEYITFNKETLSVLGIGSLMNKAAYDLGSVSLLLLIIIVMVGTVVVINRLMWRRLYRLVFSKYRLDY
jgi:NitT/TauT family transport system permease protein